jgi:hypothetical protein
MLTDAQIGLVHVMHQAHRGRMVLRSPSPRSPAYGTGCSARRRACRTLGMSVNVRSPQEKERL